MAIDESRNGKPNGIQLVQVEGFLEVARRGSVSRAAEALFITQPTLTARLHGLERELGTPLFLRTPHGMRLTDAGRAWIPFAERALRALVDGRDALQQVMTASAGHLMIAAAPAVSTYVLPEMLEKFVAAHPRVEVSVRTGHSEDVVELVLRDEVQIGRVALAGDGYRNLQGDYAVDRHLFGVGGGAHLGAPNDSGYSRRAAIAGSAAMSMP